jgi:peptidoglycan/LPS O-acetylase OafA/YrhL
MAVDRPQFRSDIEGLRGVAILLVVAFHAGISGLRGGYVGVDVFFVISGFLITGLLAREVAERGDVDLSAFYARRAWRLLPAFLLVLAVTLALGLWVYAPIDSPRIASDARAVALHAGNILFAQTAVNYHANSPNPLLHTWSLAVEEQFYIVWPLLFAFLGRRFGAGEHVSRRLLSWVALAGLISFGASVWMTRVAQPWAFFGMPSRIWEFAAGALVALTTTNQEKMPTRVGSWLQTAGLITLIIAIASVHGATPYPGYLALLPVAATVALLVGGLRAPLSRISRALALPPLQWLGRVSYAWYLWHWPLVGVAAVIDWRIGALGRVVWSLVALVLATLTYQFVEAPLRRASTDDSPVLRGAALAVGASFAAALIAHSALLFAGARASSRTQRAFVIARHDGMSHNCWGSMTENPSAPCVFGDANAQTSVALLGDSHAEHWLPALDRIGRERHWKIYAMVKPACPVPDMPELINARLKRSYVECTEWRRAMLKRIVALRPTMVVLSSFDHYMPADGSASDWHVTPENWRNGLRRTYTTLSAAGLSTIVIRGTPQPGFDVPACLSRRANGSPFQWRGCDYSLNEALSPAAIRAQDQAARGLPHLVFVDMNDQFCDGMRCSAIRRGAIVFRDDDHLTATFSRAVAPVLAERLTTALDALR